MSMSLLRAPKAPDEHCDIHEHAFRYAVYPHAGGFNEAPIVRMGYQYNVAPVIL
jgi:alpha-mannosidase